MRLLSQFVEAMDLTDLYSYMNGDYSSRSMELNCKRDINFMYLLEGKPVLDHATFAPSPAVFDFAPRPRNEFALLLKYLISFTNLEKFWGRNDFYKR